MSLFGFPALPPIASSKQHPKPPLGAVTEHSLFTHSLEHSSVSLDMSQPPIPHVKLPAIMSQKPIVPGPNSWALSATQGDPKKLPQPGPATNREKYEKKAMPPTPKNDSDNGELVVSRHRGYIQPAMPLIYSNQSSHHQKSRAATDPVVPQPLFTGGVAHLRNKFSVSKSNVNVIKKDDTMQINSASPVLSEKASQILGVWPVRDNSRRTPPASAPPSTSTPVPYRISSDEEAARSMSPSRQIQSTPAPTHGLLKDNNMPTLELGRTSLATTTETREDEKFEMQTSGNPEGMIMGDGMMNPTRTGTYGRVGEVEYVNDDKNQRVASYAGVIENAEFVDEASPAMDSNISQGQDAGELLPPTVYSPSNYDGVWEDNPYVVSQIHWGVKRCVDRITGLLSSSIQSIAATPSSSARNANARVVARLWHYRSGSFA